MQRALPIDTSPYNILKKKKNSDPLLRIPSSIKNISISPPYPDSLIRKKWGDQTHLLKLFLQIPLLRSV